MTEPCTVLQKLNVILSCVVIKYLTLMQWNQSVKFAKHEQKKPTRFTWWCAFFSAHMGAEEVLILLADPYITSVGYGDWYVLTLAFIHLSFISLSMNQCKMTASVTCESRAAQMNNGGLLCSPLPYKTSPVVLFCSVYSELYFYCQFTVSNLHRVVYCWSVGGH